jgi:hypothetical protein
MAGAKNFASDFKAQTKNSWWISALKSPTHPTPAIKPAMNSEPEMRQ